MEADGSRIVLGNDAIGLVKTLEQAAIDTKDASV